jgi:hypothetical protein
MAKILANSLRDKAHLQAFDDMMSERFGDIDLSALIPNMFDTVPAAALPYLAKQYNLLGYNGWRYADTEQKQRDLLKGWAAIKKLKGTMFSIREALKWIEIDPVDIRIDPYDLYYDGLQMYNGHFTYGGLNPFNFEISLSVTDYPTITLQTVTDMVAIIKEFKAARDLLLAINVKDVDFTETLSTSDSLHIELTIHSGVTEYDL